jgi:hypothetical protein
VDALIPVEPPAANKNWGSRLKMDAANLVRSLRFYLILIDDLKTIMDTFQFVDDVAVTEIIDQSNTSQMQSPADQLAEWSYFNFMNVFFKYEEK